MNVILDFFNKPFPLTESVPLWGFLLLVVLVSGVAEFLKQPVKILTKKFAAFALGKKTYESEVAKDLAKAKLAHRINTIIIALPIMLGVLTFFIISKCHIELSAKAIWFDGAYCGKSAIVLYELASRIMVLIKKKRAENGKVTVNDIIEAAVDGVIGSVEAINEVSKAVAEITSDFPAIDDNDDEKNKEIDDMFANILKSFDEKDED